METQVWLTLGVDRSEDVNGYGGRCEVAQGDLDYSLIQMNVNVADIFILSITTFVLLAQAVMRGGS
jgi:hypothetical protein